MALAKLTCRDPLDLNYLTRRAQMRRTTGKRPASCKRPASRLAPASTVVKTERERLGAGRQPQLGKSRSAHLPGFVD